MLRDRSELVRRLSCKAEKGVIRVRRVYPEGAPGAASVIGETGVSRPGGFPSIARLGEEVFFAWAEF
jgi:hypothetical protein